jgi:hypothetical protein
MFLVIVGFPVKVNKIQTGQGADLGHPGRYLTEAAFEIHSIRLAETGFPVQLTS